MSVMIGIIYLVIAALYLFPTLKLFRFANHARAALAGNNSQQFTESIRNLKSFFKFFGVLTAIILGLYALIFLLMLIGGVGGMMS